MVLEPLDGASACLPASLPELEELSEELEEDAELSAELDAELEELSGGLGLNGEFANLDAEIVEVSVEFESGLAELDVESPLIPELVELDVDSSLLADLVELDAELVELDDESPLLPEVVELDAEFATACFAMSTAFWDSCAC